MKRSAFIKASAGIIASTAAISSFANSKNTFQNDQNLIVPKALIPGDLIAITAPAGSIWNKSHIDKIETIMHEQGFKTILGKTLYEQNGYLAGDDELRAKELMGFYMDKSVKAILTMRGGWGCARILDQLDYSIIRANPKIIIGFSDITSLVNAIYTRANVVTYHGPCGYSSWGDFTLKQITATLVGGKPFIMKNPAHYKTDLKTWKGGKAKGQIIGGNLTVIVSMIGTKFEPKLNNKILFLEEIGEEPYRVDRMLWQMKQTGVFDKINGLIIGSFKNCGPEEPHKSFFLEDIFEQHFGTVIFPVYQGAAIGHIAPKFTLPIGIEVEIDANAYTIKTLERSVII